MVEALPVMVAFPQIDQTLAGKGALGGKFC